MRLEVIMHGMSSEEIRSRARKLGYTQGITCLYERQYAGEELYSYRTGRWALGWIRKGDKKILLSEIFRQDEAELSSEAPDKRHFLIQREVGVQAAKGHRHKRGLSPNDARFLVNMARLRGDERLLDPFAGIGGIVIECVKRDLDVFACDVDTALRPGLARVSHGRCTIADARRLPFADDTFDAIITEPPFASKFRQAVWDSLPELCRVLRCKAKMVLFISHDMHQGTIKRMDDLGFDVTDDFTLRRHGKLISHALVLNSRS